MVRGRLGEEPFEHMLDRFSAGDLGQRFVLGLVVPAPWYPAPDVGLALDRAGLLPEVLHRSDPWPGDPQLVSDGTGGRGTHVDPDVALGCLLVRRPCAAEAVARMFEVRPGPHSSAHWAGLGDGGAVPVPIPAGWWSGSELARAYRVDHAGFAVLAVELIIAGVLTPAPAPGA